jgi:hypothetical protein
VNSSVFSPPTIADQSAQRLERALEKHFSVKEAADLWGLCENSVRDIFKNEPGVVGIQHPGSGTSARTRRYVSLAAYLIACIADVLPGLTGLTLRRFPQRLVEPFMDPPEDWKPKGSGPFILPLEDRPGRVRASRDGLGVVPRRRLNCGKSRIVYSFVPL